MRKSKYGKASDQTGLGLIGAGFVERYEDDAGQSKEPENLGYVVQKECLEETKYKNKQNFSINDASATAVIFGSNHDTTVAFHLPIFAAQKEVELSNEEYNELVFLPNSAAELTAVIESGGYKGIPASNHVIGSLESYLNTKLVSRIKSRFQH